MVAATALAAMPAMLRIWAEDRLSIPAGVASGFKVHSSIQNLVNRRSQVASSDGQFVGNAAGFSMNHCIDREKSPLSAMPLLISIGARTA